MSSTKIKTDSTDLTRVLVVDSDLNRDRARSIQEAFQGNGVEVVWYRVLNGEPSPRDASGHWDILMQHAGDVSLLSLMEHPPDVAKTIYYGGEGGLDARIPSDAERLWRPLSGVGTAGALTKEEARSLCRYAKQLEGAPACLKPSVQLAGLRILTILSFASLTHSAAIARFGRDPKTWKVTEQERQALEASGWSRLDDAQLAGLQVGSVDSELGDLQQNTKWQQALHLTYGNKPLVDSLFAEISEARGRGLRTSQPIQQLVKEVCGTPNEPINPITIAAAYLALLEVQ